MSEPPTSAQALDRRPPAGEAVTGTPALSARNLTRSFDGVTVVDDVSLTIAPGESYGLLGPNGAGKTTTISMLMGLLTPDAGTVRIAGIDLAADATAAKQAVGYVPQEIALYPDLTARENLDFFCRLYGMGRADRRRRIEATLELVDLVDRADDRVETYSGGMKRRVNIAAGLLHEPSLLILDEPTVGVDPQSRNAILAGVAELNAGGMAILYTSHYMEEVERLCTRVGIMDGGRLIAEGTRRELVATIGERDRVDIGVDAVHDGLLDALRALPTLDEVSSATTNGATVINALASEARSMLPEMLHLVAQHGSAVHSVDVAEPDLEAVFLHMTGRALRD